MKPVQFAILLLTIAAAPSIVPGAGDRTETAERSVVVPIDDVKFEVTRKDLIRLTARGIAGSDRSCKIEGPATVLFRSHIITLKGGSQLVGSASEEFDIAPTGKGMVTATITVKNPTSDQPRITNYTFEVK